MIPTNDSDGVIQNAHLDFQKQPIQIEVLKVRRSKLPNNFENFRGHISAILEINIFLLSFFVIS